MKKVSSKSVFPWSKVVGILWQLFVLHCMNKQHIPHNPEHIASWFTHNDSFLEKLKKCEKMNRHIAGYETMGDQKNSFEQLNLGFRWAKIVAGRNETRPTGPDGHLNTITLRLTCQGLIFAVKLHNEV